MNDATTDAAAGAMTEPSTGRPAQAPTGHARTSRRIALAGRLAAALGLLGLLAAPSVQAQQDAAQKAQEKVLNLYSARHYQTDEALYENFTKATGIRINRVEADDAGILARLQAEGTASPADVILLVDAARLWRGEQEGLFQPLKSDVLEARVPPQFRGGVGPAGVQWWGLSTRARFVVYDKSRLKPADVNTYEKLASPALKGLFCVRSGSHPYNLSLFGSMLEHLGPQATEAWLKGLVGNMARPPKGGDTDQIRGVASGECGVALTNSYYFARLLRSSKPDDRALVDKVGVVFPNQDSWGTHVNVAGAAVARHAKHREAAQRFIEYLASDSAQRYFADGNNEYPVVAGLPANDALTALGKFKAETVPIAKVGANTAQVQQMLDRAGFK